MNATVTFQKQPDSLLPFTAVRKAGKWTVKAGKHGRPGKGEAHNFCLAYRIAVATYYGRHEDLLFLNQLASRKNG